MTYCPNCEGAGEATKALQAAEATELKLPKHHFTNDQHIFLRNSIRASHINVCQEDTKVPIISTEGALRLLTTYDNYPSNPNPIPEGDQKGHKYTCFARSALCTVNLYDLYALAFIPPFK